MSAVAQAKIESPPVSNHPAPAISPPRLPYHPGLEERFGIGISEWRALTDAVFPTARETQSIILALSYCKARKLDPFKRPVHIVPMWNAALKRMVETVWPGIAELRTTAFRTGQYAGRDEAKYGDTQHLKVGSVELAYPEWCQVTCYRFLNGQRLPFPGPRVYWMESYATAGREDSSPNTMWRKRPFGQLDKCAEAAALRAAFPEEIGNEYAAEEMEGGTIAATLHEEAKAPGVRPRSTSERLDALADIPAQKPEHAADELLAEGEEAASRGSEVLYVFFDRIEREHGSLEKAIGKDGGERLMKIANAADEAAESEKVEEASNG